MENSIKWEYIPGTNGMYKINSNGELFNCKSNYLIKGHIANGQVYVYIKGKQHLLSHLMIKIFLKREISKKEVVYHKNGNNKDNRLNNLEVLPKSVFYASLHCGNCHNERLYSIWINIKTRCYNPKCQYRKYYLDKGITICDEWKDNYKAFKEWSLNNGYSDDLTIDRIDGNKGYTPENCRWADYTIQCRNRSNTISIKIGDTVKTLKEWCGIIGKKYKTMTTYLYKYGEEALRERITRHYIDLLIKLEYDQL